MNRAAIYEIGQAARAVGLAVRALFLPFFLSLKAASQASKRAGIDPTGQSALDKARGARTAIRKPSISIFVCSLGRYVALARQLHRLERCIKMHEVDAEFREIPATQPHTHTHTQWNAQVEQGKRDFPIADSAPLGEIISGLRTRKWSPSSEIRRNGSLLVACRFTTAISRLAQLSSPRSREITLDPLS